MDDKSMDYKIEELLPVVSELAQQYTGCESTSIPYEKAQTLMEAVLFCLNEYRNACAGAPVHRNISVKEQYRTGAELLFKKVDDIRKIYNEISPQFEDFGVSCLCDTVRKGIPQFLKWYDIKFCPQNSILMFDYPLLTDCSSLKGADAVYEYIRGIQTEQLFLQALDRNYVMLALEKSSPDYREMAENICGIVLADAIGHMAVQKPLGSMGFQPDESLRLSEVFGGKSVSDIEHMITGFIKTMIRQFYGGNEGMAQYLCCSANPMAVRIYTAVQHGNLSRIFVL